MVNSNWSGVAPVFEVEFCMVKQVMTMVAWAACAAAPTIGGAQATMPALPPDLAICDCPVGDTRGGLRDLAAFAPLGLLGAIAAVQGVSPIFAAGPQMVASGGPLDRLEPDTLVAEAARNVVDLQPVAPRVDNAVPDPISRDSLRRGIRAPNTGTSPPSVPPLGTGLFAIGCVALIRTRG